MIRRPIQLGQVLIGNSVKLVESEGESSFMQEYIFRDGAKIFNAKPKITSKTLSLIGTFLENDTARMKGYDLSKMEFYNFIHSIKQTEQDIYTIGQDNRVYHQKVRVGLPSFNHDFEFVNGFDFTLPMTAPDVYWQDVTDSIYYDTKYGELFRNFFVKYGEEVKYLDGQTLEYPLVLLDPPQNLHQNIYPTQVFGDIYHVATEQGGNQVNNATENKGIYTLDATTTLRTTRMYVKPFNMFTYSDGLAFNSVYDFYTIPLYIPNITSINISFHTSESVYATLDIAPFFDFIRYKFNQTNLILTGGFTGLVNFIKVNYQGINKIRIGNLYVNRIFADGYTYTNNTHTRIENKSKKAKISAIVEFDPTATTKKININNYEYDCTGYNVAYINNDDLLLGSDFDTLTAQKKWNNVYDDDIYISIVSNQPHKLFYKIIKMYL